MPLDTSVEVSTVSLRAEVRLLPMCSLSEYVESTEHRYVLGLFLDISGAFDNAWWPGILYYLRSHGCPSGLMIVLQSYLKDRRVDFEWEGARVEKSLTKGSPQGSILGPLLWNIMFDSTENRFWRHKK